MIWRALFDQAAELVHELIAALREHGTKMDELRDELVRAREGAGR